MEVSLQLWIMTSMLRVMNLVQYIYCAIETGIDISMLNTYPVSFGIWHELHVTEGIKYDPNKLSE